MNGSKKAFKAGGNAIVTGGGKGLGRQLCLQLAQLGMYIMVTDINETYALETVALIMEKGGNAKSFVFDVSDPRACQSCIQEVIQNFGNIDLLITNAGKVAIGEFDEISVDSWYSVMGTNFFGQLHMAIPTYAHMRHNQSGRIVFISSIAGLVFQPLTGSYSASKHALVGLASTLFSDAVPNGVNVHIACPGYIDNTGIFENAESTRYSSLKIRNILADKIGGFATPEKAAQKILQKIARNRFFIVFPRNAKLLWLLFRIMPEKTVRMSHLLKKLIISAKINQPA